MKAYLIKNYDALIIAGFILLLNFNLIFDLSKPFLVVAGAAISVAAFITLVSYKQYLLYLLCLSVPLSVPVTLGESKLNFPSEIICVLFAIYFGFRLINNFKLDRIFLTHPVTILLLLDISWLLLTSGLSILPLVSFKRVLIRIIYVLCYYVFFYELYKISGKNITGIFKTYCIGMIIPIIYTLNFHSAFAFSTQGGIMASRPFYNDHTLYGAVLVFFIPFLIYHAFSVRGNLQKTMWGFMLLLFLGAGFLSYSRAAWASLIVAAVLYLVLHFRVSGVIVMIALSIIAGVTFFTRNNISDYLQRSKAVSHKNDVGMHFKSMANVKTDASNAERVNRWKCAYRMFTERPIFGFGPGTYQFVYGKYQLRSEMTTISTFAGTKGHAHSEYLGYLSEGGMFGFLNFLTLVIMVCTKAIHIIYRTHSEEIRKITTFVLLGLVTFFIHGIFNGFIETDKMAMPVFSSVAAIVFLDILNRKEKADQSSLA